MNGNKPLAASGRPNVASSAATARSQATTTEAPRVRVAVDGGDERLAELRHRVVHARAALRVGVAAFRVGPAP